MNVSRKENSIVWRVANMGRPSVQAERQLAIFVNELDYRAEAIAWKRTAIPGNRSVSCLRKQLTRSKSWTRMTAENLVGQPRVPADICNHFCVDIGISLFMRNQSPLIFKFTGPSLRWKRKTHTRRLFFKIFFSLLSLSFLLLQKIGEHY